MRIRRAVRAAMIVAVLAFSANLTYSAIADDVTLVVDGQPEAVRTFSATVGGLLADEGIVVTSGTFVAPPVTWPVADGMTVVVDLSRSSLSAPGPDVGVWVMEGTSGPRGKLVAQLAEAHAFAPGVGPSPTVAVEAVVSGKVHDVLTNAPTVGELLSAMGIAPDATDRVHPSPSTPLHTGLRVRFDEVRIVTRQVATPIPVPVENRLSFELAPGEVRVIREGSEGLVLETFKLRFVNGELMRRVRVSREVARGPVTRIRLVGPSASGGSQSGEASWYDAPGTSMTAAHPWLPFGTVVRVTYLATGESISVTINDRGPFGGRIIDLSPEAFSALAPLGQGVMQVRLDW